MGIAGRVSVFALLLLLLGCSLALLSSGVGTIAGGVNFFVTILNMRAPGMRFMRMPLFTWMALSCSRIR